MRKKQNSKLKNRLLSLWWMLFMIVFFWINFIPSLVECDTIGSAFSMWWNDLKFLSVNVFVGDSLDEESV